MKRKAVQPEGEGEAIASERVVPARREGMGEVASAPGANKKPSHGAPRTTVAIYASLFTPQEREALESLRAQGLEGEIQMLRVVIRWVMHLASGAESLEEAEKALSSLSLAMTRLARLLSAQESLDGESQGTRMLNQAITDVAQELGLMKKEDERDECN